MKNNLKALAVNKESFLVLFMLLGVVIAAPLLIKQQIITGTIVNAALIIGVATLGVRDGLLIGLVPSALALATGLLPAVLAPMVPFIIIGNTVLVLTFAYLNKLNFWAGAVAGSVLKFGFLYLMSGVVIGILVNKQVAPAVLQTMGWLQLVTALSGSLLAYGILKTMKNRSLRVK
jgi:hypothetical protein